MKHILEIDGKYTMYGMSFMAITIKNEITIKGYDEGKDLYYYSKKGKRKQFYVELKSDVLILPGWDNIKIDGDTDCFSGNAMLNFMGTVEEVKAALKENKNPYFEDWSRVVSVVGERFTDRKQELVYLDKYREGYHATADSIKLKMEG